MSHDSPRIPSIRLPQIGSPPPEPQVPEVEGAVRSPDDHHDRFLRFISSGEGLDQLVEGVEHDTVDADGRTRAQREAESEQARQESVMRRHAVDSPIASPTKRTSMFDDDAELLPSPPPLSAPHPDPAAPDAAACAPPAPDLTAVAPEYGGFTGLTSPPAVNPDDPPWATSPDLESPRPTVNPDPPLLSTATPEADPVAVSDEWDQDGGSHNSDTAPVPPDREILPPAGSLWDSTHESQSDYDPGEIVVDPTPPRAEPGPLARWVRGHYEKRWVPLGLGQKAIAGVVVAVLAIWGGFVVLSPDASAPGGAPEPAAPIAYSPDDGGPPAAAALAPTDVKAPGCAPRSQPPANAFDGKPNTAWVCIRAFNTDLQTITITYAQPVVVCSIFVIPGFEFVDENNRNRWNEHRVVTRIQWQIGGRPFRQDIDPAAHTGATISIPCVATQVITGKIFNTVPPPRVEGDNGPSDNDINSTFAISTITVNGFPAGGAPG